eukprot:10867019-Prorocentrum_lima.AAC.1
MAHQDSKVDTLRAQRIQKPGHKRWRAPLISPRSLLKQMVVIFEHGFCNDKPQPSDENNVGGRQVVN